MSSPPRSSDPRLTAAASESLGAAELEAQLDELLDAVLSSRRTATRLAQALAPLARNLQDFVLRWAAVIARTNAEMAYQFAAAAPAALAAMDTSTAEAWIIQAMDTYDRQGLYRGSAVFKNAQEFAELAGSQLCAVTFEDVAQVLNLFLCGLSGRRLKLDTAARPYTDTETIHLPARIAIFPTKEENFLVYKAIATHLWAQARFGTFNRDIAAVVAGYPDPERALELFSYLEALRLDACIGRALPGLGRELRKLRGDDEETDPRLARLQSADATVDDTVAVLAETYASLPPRSYSYMGRLRPELIAPVRAARIAKEKAAFRAALKQMLEEDGEPRAAGAEQRFSVRASSAAEDPSAQSYDLLLDGEPVAPPPQVAGLIDSILQDLGEIPDEYLAPAGDGGYRAEDREPSASDVWRGVYHEEGAYFYNEWDHGRRHYRKNWCVLRELDVHSGRPDFVDATLAKYAPQVAQLKRTFELLRGEDKLLKRQKNGDDIDLDAVIEGYADMRCGMELPERLLVKRHKSERDLAVMFMVDMSGSTKGWINDAEREALVMLCEALEVLGDRYAIYGFSGMTRKRCEIFRVKRFDEPYSAAVRSRIAGIIPQDYTRMGAAIRHLAMLLNQVEARTKLLVTLSDGKPDDYSDNYRGEYGIEDTRQALIEAHRSGIKPFCITIDREARDYLPHMYGPVNWTLVDEVARLPLKVADIYRRLTT
ncbi:MAG: nitric oxide reductase activation protein [Betaproteobacteria bacterium]|nr:nitric oxide reductase activation protein [Betaproteobacteria bacterium]